MTSQILELDEQAFNALVNRVTEASEHGLALSTEDTRLLLDALLTLATLQDRYHRTQTEKTAGHCQRLGKAREFDQSGAGRQRFGRFRQ